MLVSIFIKNESKLCLWLMTFLLCFNLFIFWTSLKITIISESVLPWPFFYYKTLNNLHSNSGSQLCSKTSVSFCFYQIFVIFFDVLHKWTTGGAAFIRDLKRNLILDSTFKVVYTTQVFSCTTVFILLTCIVFYISIIIKRNILFTIVGHR